MRCSGVGGEGLYPHLREIGPGQNYSLGIVVSRVGYDRLVTFTFGAPSTGTKGICLCQKEGITHKVTMLRAS